MLPRALDIRAIANGAFATLAIIVPTLLVVLGLDPSDDSPWTFILIAVLMGAFGFGGWTAADANRSTPLVNGAAAALCAWFLVQAAGTMRRVINDDGVSWVGLIFNGLLATTIGTVGAMVWQWRQSSGHT